MKFYHSSPTRYKKGDLIAGQPVAFMTTSEIPHYTIFEEAFEGNWYVYQVKPLGKVTVGKCWDELICPMIEVVRRVGNARGLCNKDRHPENSINGRGSQVYWKGKRK